MRGTVVEVLGRRPATLWIDSGASFSVLASDVAQEARLRAVPGAAAHATVGSHGHGQRVPAKLGRMELLQLGLDYRRRLVTLGPTRALTPERNLFWFGVPVVVGRSADRRRLHLGVDTGAKRSWLTARGARKLAPDRAEGDI
jgi:hypothetical protein